MSVGFQVEHVYVEPPREAIDALGDDRVPATTSREDLRMFLVACHQASVSIDTMSAYLGLEADTVRVELLRGIEAWNAGRRRSNETTVDNRRRLELV